VEKIFLIKKANDVGIYAVQLYVNGIKETVVVDDRFPYDLQRERWAFSRTSNKGESRNEIWVLVLEKAWAKVYGSYHRIEAGTAGEALHPLTGCPTQNLVHDQWTDKSKLWELIRFSDVNKFSMTCCVSSQAGTGLTSANMKEMNLVDGHAYTLIGTSIIRLRSGLTERLLFVRNPWGNKEWGGKWRDSDPDWKYYKK